MAAIGLLVAAVVAPAAGSQASLQRQVITGYDCARSQQASTASVQWQSGRSDVRWGEWRIRTSSGLPLLVIVAVAAPGRLQLMLDIHREENDLGAWSLSNAPRTARIAMNAGQFTDNGPWGWVVHRGREHQAPGSGSLAGALVVDNTGKWSLLEAAEIPAQRGTSRVQEAVQSYPTLIGAQGVVPRLLCANDAGVNLTHRDTRLAVGTLATGELLVAMTRFDGLGAAAGRLPLGPTTPEMISIMRALGATRALMLDGGLSAQLMVRGEANGRTSEWPGLRGVPLALVGLPVLR